VGKENAVMTVRQLITELRKYRGRAPVYGVEIRCTPVQGVM
jgi:hypothetical protein